MLPLLVGLLLVVALGAAMHPFFRAVLDRVQPPRRAPDPAPPYDTRAYLRRRKAQRLAMQAEIDRL